MDYEIVTDFNHYDFAQADETVKAVFIETPSNPLLDVTDIRRVATEAKQRGILTVVDNTFMTSYLQRPLDLRADITVYSATKYYAGHSDILAGLIVTNDDDLYAKIKVRHKLLGAILSPFDAFLLARGIKTLALRLKQHEANANRLAHYLQEQAGIEDVETALTHSEK